MPRALLVPALLTALLLITVAAHAGPPSQDERAFDARIQDELRAKDPDAANVFAEANQARDAGDDDRAARLYEDVRNRDPWFFHATRRLCGVELRRAHRVAALALCEEARRAAVTVENDATLATALVYTGDASSKPTDADVRRALSLAKDAARLDPKSEYARVAICQAALSANDVGALESCSSELSRIAPDDPATHYFAAVAAASRGRYDEGRREADRAHDLGLDEKRWRSLKQQIDEHEEAEKSSGGPWWLWKPTLAWAVCFGVLLAAGYALSKVTLARAERIPDAEGGGHARGADAALRRIYRVVLGLCCVYYYVSLPIVAALVVAFGALVLWATFAVGHIPIKLAVIALAVVAWSLLAIVRSLFVRTRDEDPGERLDVGAHPRLGAVLEEAAARVGTRPVDAVYLTPGTEVAVTERGGVLRQLRRKSERALVLGVAVLDGMRVRELQAVLAHEYGHFRNEDTAGGRLAFTVRRSLYTMALGLVRGRVATFYNPAWWFVRGFEQAFLRVSQGASRLQEILADRWAAHAYGSAAFERGLLHVVSQSVRFDAHADASLKEAITKGRGVSNLYRFEPEARAPAGEIEDAIAKAISREASPFDSHPAPAQRVLWVLRLGAQGEGSACPDGEAWSLFEDREAIERRMTEVVRLRIRKAHGIDIARDVPA